MLHQQGAPADDRICAALERADIPVWRIGGRQLAHTPVGRAVRSLTSFLLEPETVERSALLDWLSHRALRERPLGVVRRPARWERIGLDAGLTRSLGEMRLRLERWRSSEPDRDAVDLASLVGDLCQRSAELEAADSWATAAQALLNAFDDYCGDEQTEPELLTAVRDALGQLPANDALGAAWSPRDGLIALNRAFSARVVRDPRRLIGGVNVGAASGPARGIRYDAIFVAGVAERIFPAVGRQDPLLSDDDRAAINVRIPDALALQRDRADSDRHAWALARRAATRQFTASWSRRGSAVGAPARPSSLILESAQDSSPAPSETTLAERGCIERISTSIVAATPSSPQVESDDWSAVLAAPQERSLDLALLTAPHVDIGGLLPHLWSQTDAALRARRQRSASRFTDFDGLPDTSGLDGEWRPLERVWSAAALETYVTCPYRFYLRHVIGIRADAESDRPDQPRRRARGTLIRRILASWVREYDHVKADRTWFEYADSPSDMNAVAHPILESAEDSGALGPPANVSATRADILSDLDRGRRREAVDARDGWRPLETNVVFDDAPIRVKGERTLRLRGVIDRIDRHVDGRRRAVHFFTGRTLPDVRGFVNGSSLRSVAGLAALTQRGVPIRQSAIEHRSVVSLGHFESQTLHGEALTSRGSRSAPSDGERLRDTLALIADQLEAAQFIPYPGHPLRDRPNCRRCPYESSCTADIGARYQHKARHQQDAVRDLETLRRQRI